MENKIKSYLIEIIHFSQELEVFSETLINVTELMVFARSLLVSVPTFFQIH